jgi:hypothetical protein
MENFNINDCLNKLSRSKFRASFHLKKADIDYISAKSIETIKRHAYDFITKKLAPANPANDGKQTATHGHPVFVAQHATATCCRGCFEKWYHVPKGQALGTDEIDFAVNIIMAWIEQELKKNQNSNSTNK